MAKKVRKAKNLARDVNQAAFASVQHVIALTEEHQKEEAPTRPVPTKGRHVPGRPKSA